MAIDKYIYSYEQVNKILDDFTCNYPRLFKKQEKIGTTSFGYKINEYKLGCGNKKVILMAATHGCELVTVTFIIYFITTVLNDQKYINYLNDYSFYIIPILNPEGYVISSSNVLANIQNMDLESFEIFSNKYLMLYDKDDYNAKHFNKKYDKLYKTVFKCSTDYIPNNRLKNMVQSILKNCKLDARVLPIWSSNGMGIDINANSIHQFKNMYIQRMTQKYAKLRYNDIPTDMPSPTGYPGKTQFDKNCPENICLYKYVLKLYRNNFNTLNNNKLIAFFSYHSTGAQIYGFPDKSFAYNMQYNFILNSIKNYSFYTNYEPMNESYKYGVMDYYRIILKNVATLTIELSKSNANPIGPFADLRNIEIEFENNIKAIFYTIEKI